MRTYICCLIPPDTPHSPSRNARGSPRSRTSAHSRPLIAAASATASSACPFCTKKRRSTAVTNRENSAAAASSFIARKSPYPRPQVNAPALRSPPRARRDSHPIAPPTSPSLSRSPPRERRDSHPIPIPSHRTLRSRERQQVVRHPSSDTSHGAFTALFHCTHPPVPPLPKIVMVRLQAYRPLCRSQILPLSPSPVPL